MSGVSWKKALRDASKETGLWELRSADILGYPIDIWVWDAEPEDLPKVEYDMSRVASLVESCPTIFSNCEERVVKNMSEELGLRYMSERQVAGDLDCFELKHVHLFFSKENSEYAFDYIYNGIESDEKLCFRFDNSGSPISCAIET